MRSDAPTRTSARGESASPPQLARPVPGEPFGGYRILRLLGRGGMGEVYEADHLETGRRVALKVMGHTLGSEADRKRFLREGRLAASVSHPNVIYVYGTEEIGGAPVIAMELVHEGTLQALVKKRGPLPAAEAVDKMIQVIAGLETARQAGVLHRDIKPANCFVGGDGTVKVGDFGLSISTLARPESVVTLSGSMLGTPALASPEQLRGEALDVRSDIYSVGATLYYVVTGRLPFDAEDLVKLIATVLDKPAGSPAQHRPDLPPGLCKVILRCLAKLPSARYESYEALHRALLPFSGLTARPAHLGLRFVAGLIDDLVAWSPQMVGIAMVGLSAQDAFLVHRTPGTAALFAAATLWAWLYYAFCESLWGAGVGKSLCGLRVTGPGGVPPGLPRALGRVLLSSTQTYVPALAVCLLHSGARYGQAMATGDTLIVDWLFLPLFLLLFSTIRQRNGWAAVHDLATATRVIMAPERQARSPLIEVAWPAPPQPAPSNPRLGPYVVVASDTGPADAPVLGFDEALRRHVWIVRRPDGAAPVATRRRDVSRSTRLRWLNGRREGGESWDAYEAPAGRPLLALIREGQSWNAVRFWLLDLAEEFRAARDREESMEDFRMDRVWIRANGQAMLLDFPCPGLAETGGAPGDAAQPVTVRNFSDVQRLLHQVADRALHASGVSCDGARHSPPPLSAGVFLRRLGQGAFERIEILLGNLVSLTEKPAQASALLRIKAVLLPAAWVGLISVLFFMMFRVEMSAWEKEWSRLFPGRPSLRVVLHAEMEAVEPSDKRAMTLHAGREYADVLTNGSFWAEPRLGGILTESERRFLTNAVAEAARADAASLVNARAIAAGLVDAALKRDPWQPYVAVSYLAVGMPVFLGLLSLVLILVLGQPPLLRVLGLAVVDATGRLASRMRLLWRWGLSWGLTLGVAVGIAIWMSMVSEHAGHADLVVRLLQVSIPCLVMAALFLGMLARRPWRGWQDRFSGTCVVPR